MVSDPLNKIFNNKIKDKNLKIGVIGLGYVGLPLLYSFSKNKKLKAFGFDTDKSKIDKLRAGKSYINYFKKKNILEMITNGVNFYNDFNKIKDIDFIIVCLPTPLKKNKSPDMSYIVNFMKSNSKYFKKNQALSLESTTYPGTCRELILPYLLKKKFKIGKDFSIIYSPEREDPGNKKFSLTKIPKVVGGLTNNCREIGSSIYSLLNIKIIKTPSIEIAEMTKLLENIYRSVNIGMINELKVLCQKMNINIFDVIKAAKTKPFGFHAFYPGPGYGGHCIPIDPFLLTWRAKKFNFDTKFIKLSGLINNGMPNYIVNKILKLKKKFNIRKILILGIAYKKNVDDIRESPSFEIFELLKKKNFKVDYLDPYIPLIKSRKFKGKKKSISLKYELIKKYDLSLILTDHDSFNFKKIKSFSKVIIDCRGRYQPDPMNNIFQA